MRTEIKAVERGELERCAEVIRLGFGTVARDFGLTKENCPTNGAFIETERLLSDFNKGKRMYGLFSDGGMVGFMQLDKRDDGCFELEKITVVPQYRHAGFGKSLLRFAADRARETGAAKLTIGIIEENTVLKNWYEENGFVHMGTKKFDFLPFTVGFMEYRLE